MANCVIVMGASGTGKSTSIKGLDPKKTIVINVLGKKLPFKGSGALYNKENQNLFHLDNYDMVTRLLTEVNKNKLEIGNVVIDDSIYLMRKEFFNKYVSQAGYNRFTEMAQHFQNMIQVCEGLREDMNIFFLMHSEEIVSDGVIVGYQPSTIGKLLLSQYNPVECVGMVLFSSIRYTQDGTPEYGFYTHRVKLGNIEIPAKTPEGLFEDDFIPNDLGFVTKCMLEYFN